MEHHFATLIGGGAELRQLAHDVVALRLLRLLFVAFQDSLAQQLSISGIKHLQREAPLHLAEYHTHSNLADSRLAFHQPFKLHVVVAIEGHALSQRRRHLQREEPVALHTIHAEAFKLFLPAIISRTPVISSHSTIITEET